MATVIQRYPGSHMPIIKADNKLVLYAHVPKCGGSAVSWYLKERFGLIAFQDSHHTRHAAQTVWSRTSPQHIDRQSLAASGQSDRQRLSFPG